MKIIQSQPIGLNSLLTKSINLSRETFVSALMFLFVAFSFSSLTIAEQPKNVPLALKQPLTEPQDKIDPWLFLNPYIAKYSFYLDEDKLGHAIRTLTNKNDHWTLQSTAKAKKFILNMKSEETSKFHFNNFQLVNDQFTSTSKVTFKKAKQINQIFDWDNKIEIGSRNKKTWELALEHLVFDRVSHLIQMRADLLTGKTSFDYPVSHKGKIHRYIYRMEKEETIVTAIGEIRAQKFVREKSDKENFIVWFAPELNYFPIKISQFKLDKPEVTLLLKSLELNNNPSN